MLHDPITGPGSTSEAGQPSECRDGVESSLSVCLSLPLPPISRSGMGQAEFLALDTWVSSTGTVALNIWEAQGLNQTLPNLISQLLQIQLPPQTDTDACTTSGFFGGGGAAAAVLFKINHEAF